VCHPRYRAPPGAARFIDIIEVNHLERHAPPPQIVRRPHGGRSASRPGTTSTARSSSMGETALQQTRRRGSVSQERSGYRVAPRC